MMWERCTEIVAEKGTKIVFDSTVTKIEHADGRARRGDRRRRRRRRPVRVHPRDLVDADQRAARGRWTRRCPPRCSRRPTACATASTSPSGSSCREEYTFPDNWIYINDANVKVGRIQNFGRWSPYLVKDGRTCLGLELFVNEGDEWWTMSDEDLIATGKRELDQIGLVDGVEGRGRLRRAHAEGVPVLRRDVQGERRRRSRRGSSEHAPNVYPVGRNGMHRYNNQDHSMFTAMLSVENIFGAAPRHLVGERRSRVPRRKDRRTVETP